MTGFDITDCLARVMRQDQAAARALVEHLYPLVNRIACAHLPKRATPEDLAQEVFLKLFARLDQYKPRAGVPFEHWVSRLAVRICLDSLRAEKRRPELVWSDLSAEEAAWLEFMRVETAAVPDTSAACARELVEKLLGQLPPRDRWLIHWLDLEGQSVKEISQLTGWSVSRVKVRAFRVRRRLRQLAAELEGELKHE